MVKIAVELAEAEHGGRKLVAIAKWFLPSCPVA
jgi:hypothetical protein